VQSISISRGLKHYGRYCRKIQPIDGAILPFVKSEKIDIKSIQKTIRNYDEALLSLSRNQKIAIAGVAFLGAVVGMVVGFLLGFALGAALSPDVTSVHEAFRKLFSAFVEVMGELGKQGLIITSVGTLVAGAGAFSGVAYLTDLAFFKMDPIKPEAQDLSVSTAKLRATLKQS
jgi:hypothetical protein